MGKAKRSKLGKILKNFSRFTSLNIRSSKVPFITMSKSKSWPRSADPDEEKRCLKRQVAPIGCFSAYIGPERERFVIKTEYVNHPLFRMLLEEAEMEYRFNREGPLALPCQVDLFYKILHEMDNDEMHQRCSFPNSYMSYRLLSPCAAIN